VPTVEHHGVSARKRRPIEVTEPRGGHPRRIQVVDGLLEEVEVGLVLERNARTAAL